jgi:hypothetical protein
MTVTTIQPPTMPLMPPDVPAPPLPAPAGPPAVTPATPDGPLTPGHMQALALAALQSRKLRSAAKVALFNAICIGVFGGVSLLFAVAAAIFREFDWLGVIMAVGLGAISWNEFRGRRLLQQLNPRAPAVLGWNQLALLGLVAAYAAWMIGAALLGPNPYDEVMRKEPMTRNVLGNIGNLHKMLTAAVYGGLIVGTLIFQGLNALYYFTRAKALQDYLAETPPWVVDLQRVQAGGR